MMLEKTEGTINKWKSRETGNKEHTRRRSTKQKHNTRQYVLNTTMRKKYTSHGTQNVKRYNRTT